MVVVIGFVWGKELDAYGWLLWCISSKILNWGSCGSLCQGINPFMHAFTETLPKHFEFCLLKKNSKKGYVFPVTVWPLDSVPQIAALLSDPLQSNFKYFGVIRTDMGTTSKKLCKTMHKRLGRWILFHYHPEKSKLSVASLLRRSRKLVRVEFNNEDIILECW